MLLYTILLLTCATFATGPGNINQFAGGIYLNEIPDYVYTVCSDEGHTVEVLTRKNKVLGINSVHYNSNCDPELTPKSSRVAMV